MAPKRSRRPRTMSFGPTVLLEKLTALANLKVVEWQWDGASYEALGRSQTTRSVETLALHLPVLLVLLALAPSGFPAHSCLREGLILCHQKFKIFDEAGKNIGKAANDAAGNWRTTTRHVYDMAKDGVKEPSMQQAIDMISLPSSRSTAAVVELVSSDDNREDRSEEDGHVEESCLVAADVQSMFADFEASLPDEIVQTMSDDDVAVVKVADCDDLACTCPECLQAAEADIRVPSAKRGGQHTETVPIKRPAAKQLAAKTRKRLRWKQHYAIASIVQPVTMIERKKRTAKKPRECYLLHAVASNRTVATQNEHQSPHYKRNIEILRTLIGNGKITTVSEVREWIMSKSTSTIL